MKLNSNKQLLLYAVRDGGSSSDYSHLRKEISYLVMGGFIKCYYNEQHNIIHWKITPKGEQLLLPRINGSL